METKEFVLTRALATRSAQENIASTWVWPHKTVLAWNTTITSFETHEQTTTDAKTAMNSFRGAVDVQLAALHEKTVKVLGLLRTMVELTDPSNSHLISTLGAAGTSRTAIIEEAEELASAWDRVDGSWEPVAGMDLAGFLADIVACQATLKAYLDARTAWRSETGKWSTVTASLNRDCMAWYSDATHVFKVGTSEGDMIRSMVPTTTDLTPYPLQAEVTLNTSPGPGAYSILMVAGHASKFDVYQRLAGETEYVKVGVEIPEELFVMTGLAPGNYEVKAQGRNSRGGGPDSEAVTIVVS